MYSKKNSNQDFNEVKNFEEVGRWEQRHLVNVAELAKVLDVPVSWLYQRTRLGQKAIPMIKLGKYVRFDPDEVIKFFKSRKNPI